MKCRTPDCKNDAAGHLFLRDEGKCRECQLAADRALREAEHLRASIMRGAQIPRGKGTNRMTTNNVRVITDAETVLARLLLKVLP